MSRFAVLGVLCVAVLAFAGGASARTTNQAYLRARACLVSHAAKKVRPQAVVFHRQPANVIYAGGSAELQGHLFHWWYKPDYGPQATGVSVQLFGHEWPTWARTMITGCVQKTLGLGPAGGFPIHVSEE